MSCLEKCQLGFLPAFSLDFFFFFEDTKLHSALFVNLGDKSPCHSHNWQIFSPNLWVVFLFMVSFVVQKPLSLIRFHLLIFVFISIKQRDGLKNTLL